MTRQHILITISAIMILLSSCGKDEGKVIPRKKLAKIYAEMFVTDQWITSTPGVRQIADTSLVYEPILEKYGYDSKDYRASIDKYMDDPERFARILRVTTEILDARIEELQKEQARVLALSRLPKIKYDFKIKELAPFFKDEPYIHYYDSLEVSRDSLTLLYRFLPVEGDTLYDGPAMIVKDTLTVVDSLAVSDSMDVDFGKVDSLKSDKLKGGKFKVRDLEKEAVRIDSMPVKEIRPVAPSLSKRIVDIEK